MDPELWTLPLEVVTPAFVGGAEPNERAELRMSSVRGAWRAWYRLPSQSHLRESALFGGTGPGEGAGIVLAPVGRTVVGKMPWNPGQIRRQSPGIAYLGFSLGMRPNDRKAIPAETRFGIRVLLPRGLDQRRADLLWATIWMWMHFGGLGSRSRRGFGSLAFAGTPTFTTLHAEPLPGRGAPAPATGGTTGELGGAIVKGLDRIVPSLPRRDPNDTEPPPPPALRYWLDFDHGSRAVLWGGAGRRGWPNGRETLNAIGEMFREFRGLRGIDGLPRGALRMLEAGQRLPHTPHRAALGLPLGLQRIRPRGERYELLPVVDGKTGARAPSPLLFRIAPMGDRFVVALLLLSGTIAGRDLGVRERRSDRGEILGDPGNDLPSRFLDGLPGRTELFQ